MSFFQKFFRAQRSDGRQKDAGINAEHLELRRAIERCDALRPAFESKQLSLADLVSTLERNNFSRKVIAKAIGESLGEDVAKRI
ncbi:hypothetical protein HY480_01880 [Candidatus Uhrbacteria bacterium]|nr:hypothetical protein [Candidatus Uhrbacteria bacterium]